MTAGAALVSGVLGGPDLVGALLILTAAMFTSSLPRPSRKSTRKTRAPRRST